MLNAALRERVETMMESLDPDDRLLGHILFSHLRFIPVNKTCEVLREVTRGLEEALHDFEQYWAKENGE